MIGTLWLIAEAIGVGILATAVVSHNWTRQADRPWFFALMAVTAASITAHALLGGHLALAALYSVLALLAAVATARAVRRQRGDRRRHVVTWSRFR
jgi:hypothetical protein